MIAVIGWGSLAFFAANCGDQNNDNPGVDLNAMQMDASMGDGGMMDGGGMDGGGMDGGGMDGGDMDGGMGDGGMDDGGMMAGDDLKLPAGPSLIVAQTNSGKQGLASIDLATGAVHDRLLLSDFRIDGSMSAGIPLGQITRLTVDASGVLLHISIGTPARAVVFHLLQSQQLSDSYVGGVGDSTGKHALSADTSLIYSVSPQANRVTRVVASAGTFTSVNAGSVPALVAPSSAHRAPDNKLYVGSSSAAKRGYVVFDDTGTLAYNAGLSVTLSDPGSGAEGAQPGPCATPAGQAYFYCGSAAVLADGGTSGGYLWKLSSGNTPKQVAGGLSGTPGAVVASPGGERLFVADGQVLRAYWVRDDPDSPSPVGTFDAGAKIDDIAPVGNGEFVYVSSAAANVLVKLRVFDLAEARRYTELERPGALVYRP